MNFKKFTAALAAAAMAVTMTAVSAFAATVTLDSEYVGAWGAGACIPKTELEAIGGDVKVTLDIETRNLAGTADQFLVAPMDYDNSWTRVTDQLTSDTMSAKADGFIVIREHQTSVEFVITADTISSLGDSGLGFQVQNVIVKSANLEAGSPEGAYAIIDEADVQAYCFGTGEEAAEEAPAEEAPAEEAAEEAPAEEATEEVVEEVVTEAAPVEEAVTEAPAADTAATAPAATGNTAAATVAIVMVAAGAAALVSKRK